jgi:hypothetical protein
VLRNVRSASALEPTLKNELEQRYRTMAKRGIVVRQTKDKNSEKVGPNIPYNQEFWTSEEREDVAESLRAKLADGSGWVSLRIKGKPLARPIAISEMAPDGDEAMIERIFFDSMPAAHVEVVSIQPVGKVALMKKFLKRVATEESSVELTFHATKEEIVPLVLKDGLRTTHCEIGVFGSGAYVGLHAGLAHQYSSKGPNGWRRMFAVLVNPGQKVVQGDWGLEKSAETAADRIWNPQQYCFFDADRLFVSHLITYREVESKGNFSKTLSDAVNRAGKRVRKHGLR